MIYCESEENKYQCTVRNTKFSLVADATIEKGGKYEGFRPHELIEAAFASCLNMTIRMEADKLNYNLETVNIIAELKKQGQETFVEY